MFLTLLSNREQWVEHMVEHGYKPSTWDGVHSGVYEEPEKYPCFEYAPRQNDHPAYLYKEDLERMLKQLQ